jgi:hypothetical protein
VLDARFGSSLPGEWVEDLGKSARPFQENWVLRSVTRSGVAMLDRVKYFWCSSVIEMELGGIET